MAFAYLKPAQAIWRGIGLEFLLVPEDLASGVATPGSFPTPPLPQARNKAPAQPSKNFSRPIDKNPAQAPEKPRKWQPLPVDQWPSQWRDFLARQRKGKFTWTYWNLGADLLKINPINNDDEQRAARGNLLRKIFADLALPPGSHTFWPVGLPDSESGGISANREVFWSALPILESRGVIIMGSLAARALLDNGNLRPLANLRNKGQLVWILWEIDSIVQTPEFYNKAITFLRQSLAPFCRR